jgi:hypothetical protein
MTARRLLRRGLFALAAGAALAPAVALAGKPATSGQQKLQITDSLTPAKAGAKNVKLSLHISYTNPKHPGQQPPYNSRQLILKGQVLVHPHAVPACKESAVIKANNKTSGCPADTKIGSGTVLVNAAPTVKQPISGTITLYNGVNDGGFAGHPKGARNQFLYIQTSIHVNGTYTFYIHKLPGGGTELVSTTAKPKKAGVTPGSFTVERIDVSESAGTAQKPYLSDMSTCPGSWRFSFTVTNWFNQPSVTAHDKVACRS